VVPGEYFFPGLENVRWQHKHECMRLNFARPKHEIEAGFTILAKEIERAYAGNYASLASASTNLRMIS